jgi:hypothetical protein
MHFNLIDIIDARRQASNCAQVFPTEDALQEYTKRTSSYFPRSNSKAGNLLRQLPSLRNPNNVLVSPPVEKIPITKEQGLTQLAATRKTRSKELSTARAAKVSKLLKPNRSNELRQLTLPIRQNGGKSNGKYRTKKS